MAASEKSERSEQEEKEKQVKTRKQVDEKGYFTTIPRVYFHRRVNVISDFTRPDIPWKDEFFVYPYQLESGQTDHPYSRTGRNEFSMSIFAGPHFSDRPKYGNQFGCFVLHLDPD
jgi:hypothetical protein